MPSPATAEAAMEGGPAATVSAGDAAARAAHKRYEALMMVRNKAIKGKGAWYWAHLEPLLVHNPDTGLPKAVKLKCCLCDTLFSASNPSRTASEHLTRGTCPNFATTPRLISSVSPNADAAIIAPPPPPMDSPTLISSSHSHRNHRKRSSPGFSGDASVLPSPSYHASPPCFSSDAAASTAVTVGIMGQQQQQRHRHQFQQQQQQQHRHQFQHHHPQLQQHGHHGHHGHQSQHHHHQQQQHLVLKSPKTSPDPGLSKTQMDCALDYLADWVYESSGSVSYSSVEHPKFKLFLTQVGLPPGIISRREVFGSRLDAKYQEAKAEAESRIRDAMFFQIASDGWRLSSECGNGAGHSLFGWENLVNLTVNLPNGTSVYRRAVFTGGQVPSEYAEEVLWEGIKETCGNAVQQCAGIVADRFKNKALRNLESQNHWMVNLSCQFQAFYSLIKDFYRELPLFRNAAENCLKLGNFVIHKSQIRNSFFKYQTREDGHSHLLRLPPHREQDVRCFEPVYALIEDILSSARALQSVLLDESYEIASMEDQVAREVGEMLRDVGFWNDLEAVHSLVKTVKEMAHEMENERPLVGHCLPLWEELRSRVRDWCAKFQVSDGLVEKVIERRFKKNYHPAWAAAYILDPLYLTRDTSGRYVPQFKHLTHQQEKDVDKLITRLVSREEAHIAVMELMKWRTEGLDPVYAQAVQLKRRDPVTGKMRIANPQSSRLVWETHLTEFKSLGKVAVRLIFLHATCRGFKSNLSLLRWVRMSGHSRAGVDRAQKLIFIAAQAKLERRVFSNDDDKDAELFTLPDGEDDVLNEVLIC